MENVQNKRKSTDAQIRAKTKYANSRWRPAIYIDKARQEEIENRISELGYKSFNEYVGMLIDQDLRKRENG